MPDPLLIAQVAEIVQTVGKIAPEVTITAETRLVEDLGIDSLDLVGVFLRVQDDLGVSVDEMDVPGLVRVGDLAAYIERRRPASSAAA
jgi:acyl carrier protein